ncbi:2-amino-4-hydroxy-6-hydroxymethyldihydropteridine diphosphokinase [Candidatus Villigracilis saccharophilus]|uniref:2-amino-4-hydroxy-6- hydroxymethyldihydropteridine diphosphokinase n=1 Tax=Candidatus Villigracilis saccharophilus TaxID=3140684 RepID=UPI003135D445|nr:2-amino-4-hydroxy-6-hydroxymethyldihydropteridine diphosphokinase [Anaerolineales bacterium]
MDHIIFLALGSNMGNRLTNLKAAVLNFSPQISVKKKSSVYETPPWGFVEQDAFLNQVIKAETYLEPEPLLRHLKRLETALGRVPNFQNGPRLIDIDILFFDDAVIDTPPLVVPHPRLHERAFVLVPLAEIEPDFVHPTLQKPIRNLRDEVDRSEIRIYTGK